MEQIISCPHVIGPDEVCGEPAEIYEVTANQVAFICTVEGVVTRLSQDDPMLLEVPVADEEEHLEGAEEELSEAPTEDDQTSEATNQEEV